MNPSPNGRWNKLQDRAAFELDDDAQERFALSQAFAQPTMEDLFSPAQQA